MNTTHELRPGDSITITSSTKTIPTTFTREQINELVSNSRVLDQFNGFMEIELKTAATLKPDANWAKQDVEKCAAGGCIVGSRYLEYAAYSMLKNTIFMNFPSWYVHAINNGLIGENDGCWNWQLDESRIYDFLPWPLNSTIVNNYHAHCKHNWLDGKQYREWRRTVYGTDGSIVNVIRDMLPSVLCLRDSDNPDKGTHTSVCALYQASDGEYWYVMLDTAFPEYRGALMLSNDIDQDAETKYLSSVERALKSPDEFVRDMASKPIRFGPGTPRYLHNAYTHVAALSVLMRAFAASIA